MAEVKAGLEDVIAGTSEICFIDGREGRLLYRGYSIDDLVDGGSSFEEVVFLLYEGRLPTGRELDAFRAQLVADRALPGPVVDALRRFPPSSHPMDALRTGVSLLGLYDPLAADMSMEASREKARRLVAQMATLVAAIGRVREGKTPVEPRPDLGHAANFLYMLQGREPDSTAAHVMDVALILHADHELNASTFAARVTAATLADMHSAITSAVATLKGPLHGGANEQVMRMLLAIGRPEAAEEWVRQALARKEKIMGFGHRVYRTMDPRAVYLRRFSQELGQRTGQPQWYEISERIRDVMAQEKNLYPNVDFYSASTYYSLGIPLDLYTPIFAVSRVSGWTAHVLEQYAHNRLIRPRAEYVGPARRPYVSLAARG